MQNSVTFSIDLETFEKCAILLKAKKGDNFNHPREIGLAFHPSTIVPTYGAGKAGAGIGQKGAF
jgi:hypothetical protein